MTPAYDAELGLIYFGTGNPSPSNDGGERPGDNLYNNSTVALEAETGTLRWYVQHIPHDLWDYDLPNPPILARVDGRKVVLHAGKEGWLYVMDAVTGATIRRSEGFVPQENMWVAPDAKGILMRPGIFGGANWPPSSFSPQTGLMYIPARDRPNMATVNESAEREVGKMYTAGSFPAIRGRPPTGVLSAVDPRRAKCAGRYRRRPGPGAERSQRPADSCSWASRTAGSAHTTRRTGACFGRTSAAQAWTRRLSPTR